MKDWERKLKQREDMLCDGRQNLGEKEEKIVETEKNLRQKERDLEVLEKKIDSSNSLLKGKEAEIIKRVADLDVEEKVHFVHFHCVSMTCVFCFFMQTCIS